MNRNKINKPYLLASMLLMLQKREKKDVTLVKSFILTIIKKTIMPETTPS